jgi:hypothetical protein
MQSVAYMNTSAYICFQQQQSNIKKGNKKRNRTQFNPKA